MEFCVKIFVPDTNLMHILEALTTSVLPGTMLRAYISASAEGSLRKVKKQRRREKSDSDSSASLFNWLMELIPPAVGQENSC